MPAKKKKETGDDLDASIARRVARNKDYLALLADAQARLGVERLRARPAEIGLELSYLDRLTRLQRRKIKELTQSLRVLLAHAEGTKQATAKQLERARWRLQH